MVMLMGTPLTVQLTEELLLVVASCVVTNCITVMYAFTALAKAWVSLSLSVGTTPEGYRPARLMAIFVRSCEAVARWFSMALFALPVMVGAKFAISVAMKPRSFSIGVTQAAALLMTGLATPVQDPHDCVIAPRPRATAPHFSKFRKCFVPIMDLLISLDEGGDSPISLIKLFGNLTKIFMNS